MQVSWVSEAMEVNSQHKLTCGKRSGVVRARGRIWAQLITMLRLTEIQ